jgi:aryl-alcohol dehydrogenase-like predicted oxidoreductase
MQFSELGHSGVKISKLSLGTLNVLKGGTVKEKLEIFDAALDHGVNYFDTSDNYEKGEAEKFLGTFISNKDRGKILIGTKCFFPKDDSPLHKGLRKENINYTVDTSLQRLNTDYLDFFYCHRFDQETPLEETIMTIESHIKQGKIRNWGVSAFSVSQLYEIYYTAKELNCTLPKVGQYPYNLFNRTIEMDLREAFLKLKMGVIAYYPLSQGILTGKYTGKIESGSRAADPEQKNQMWDFTDDKIKKANEFAELARGYGYSPSALAVKWCMRHPAVCSTLSNVNSLRQLTENLEFINVDLTPKILSEIEVIFNNAPVNQYTGQKYQI